MEKRFKMQGVLNRFSVFGPTQNQSGPMNAPEFRDRLSRDYASFWTYDPLFAVHSDVVFQQQAILGEGGMARVLRVLDRRLGREAALKIILPNRQKDDLIERFESEIQIMARLDHPAIPSLYEAGKTRKGQLYMLMRLIEGETLEAKIERLHSQTQKPGPGDWRPLLESLVKVTEAVAYAHDQGIIHRDIKPLNIMIGRFGEAMLMDWGIARDDRRRDESRGVQVSSSSAFRGAPNEVATDLTGPTQHGAVIGTFGYMAPEQAAGESVDHRADIFALGAVLCAILTGKTPISGQSQVNQMIATIRGQFLMPQEINPRVPPELDSLTRKALTVDADQRMASAREFMNELNAYLRGDWLACHRYSLREKVVKAIQRNPGSFTAVVAILSGMALVLLFALSIDQLQRRKALTEAKLHSQTLQSQIAEDKQQEAEELKRIAEAQTKKREALLEMLTRARNLSKSQNRPKEVSELLSRVLKSETASPALLKAAATIYEDAGFTDLARQCLRDVSQQFPPAYDALFELYRLSSFAIEKHNVVADTPLKELIQRAQERNDRNEYTLWYEGLNAQREGRIAFAIERYNESLKVNPNLTLTYHNRALCFAKLKKYEQALKDYATALKINPKFAFSRYNRGALLTKLGRDAQALSDVEQAIRDNPLLGQSPTALTTRAGIFMSLNDYKRALTDLNQSLRADPEYIDALYFRAQVYLYFFQYSQALEDIDKVIQKQPKTARSYVIRARIQRGLGDYEKAYKDVQRALSLVPGAHEALALRADLYRHAKRIKEALRDISEAIAKHPRKAEYYFQRGKLRQGEGQWQQALDDFRRLLKLSPQFPSRGEVKARMRSIHLKLKAQN